ncbi:MAG TPA: hypothetical protein DC054_14320 [Blastocatellia bacterium]|nr:hypothetical protein [Blastocatellia bacterium]
MQKHELQKYVICFMVRLFGVYSLCVMAILFLQGMGYFHLSERMMMGLLLTILGKGTAVFVMIGRFLFSNKA